VRTSRLLAVAAPAALLACSQALRTPTTAQVTSVARVDAAGAVYDVLYTPGDAGELVRIRRALLTASPRLSRWGSFRRGVSIRLLPDHEALEEAAGRRGYPWLRAWTFTDEILLQSPRSWRTVNDDDFAELLTHELTHALMYQLIDPADRASWSLEEPPRWFREGMASVTAGEGHRRLSRAEIIAWLTAHPDADLLHASTELYRTEKAAVYGAAHRTFELLIGGVGDAAVRDLLRRLGQGERFDEAFRGCTGRPLADFEAETLRSGFDSAAVHLDPRGGAAGSP
jgi:hypothetical protein